MTAPGSRLPDLSTLFPFRAWFDDRALRSWTTWLFVALVAVPPLAFVVFRSAHGWGGEASSFAFYFAAAWFFVLWVVVRPQQVRGAALVQVAVLALVVESPLAIGLERLLDAGTDNVLLSIVTVGVPEEFAKMVPVVAFLLWQSRSDRRLPARDALFLGAVSGLVFGAVEAVEYVVDLPGTGTGAALTVVWRLLTDPRVARLLGRCRRLFPGPRVVLPRAGAVVRARRRRARRARGPARDQRRRGRYGPVGRGRRRQHPAVPGLRPHRHRPVEHVVAPPCPDDDARDPTGPGHHPDPAGRRDQQVDCRRASAACRAALTVSRYLVATATKACP
jgi:hypothetical protein